MADKKKAAISPENVSQESFAPDMEFSRAAENAPDAPTVKEQQNSASLTENSDNKLLHIRLLYQDLESEFKALQSAYFVVAAENGILTDKLKDLDLENNYLVNKDQLNQLGDRVEEYKADIVALVNVFQSFAGLFTGKTGVLGMLPVITRLVNDPATGEKVSHLLPIIEKYTAKSPENV